MLKDLEKAIGVIAGGIEPDRISQNTEAPHFLAQPLFRTKPCTAPTCELLFRSPQIHARESFFHEAEQCGGIVDLDVLLVEMALAETRCLRVQGIEFWINVSPQTVKSPQATSAIAALFTKDGFADRVGLEVTERQVVLDRKVLDNNLIDLKSTGAMIILDDFGSGASNFDLACNPVFDAVKVERRMVERAVRSSSARSLVRLLREGASSSAVRVVAEGIETSRMAATTAEAGFDELQGYHFSAPLPLQQVSSHRLCGAAIIQQQDHRLAGGQ